MRQAKELIPRDLVHAVLVGWEWVKAWLEKVLGETGGDRWEIANTDNFLYSFKCFLQRGAKTVGSKNGKSRVNRIF